MPALESAARRFSRGPDALHRALARSHSRRLAPSLASLAADDWEAQLSTEIACRRLERELVEAERAELRSMTNEVPRDADGFIAWFEELKRSGPGQGDPLFPWLAEHATFEDVCWFLRQEMASEAGFDDLVALSQLKLPARPKLEMARNYWDEMGQGHEGGMHGPLLDRLVGYLPPDDEPSVWESLALGNLMVALATSREYAYQSIGALGVIELTAPTRAEYVNAALRRLGFDGAARRYYALHATLDVRHSHSWNREVLAPLVQSDGRIAPFLAEGALMRLRAGARCFERYRRRLMPELAPAREAAGAH
jgi:hypothetical protein